MPAEAWKRSRKSEEEEEGRENAVGSGRRSDMSPPSYCMDFAAHPIGPQMAESKVEQFPASAISPLFLVLPSSSARVARTRPQQHVRRREEAPSLVDNTCKLLRIARRLWRRARLNEERGIGERGEGEGGKRY